MTDKWVADFETTACPDDCRVWLWGICSIDDPNNFVYGKDIETFFEWCEKHNNPVIYFHNLKFDSQFIISRLLSSGYEWTESRSTKTKTFSSLITSTGEYYSVRIVFNKTGHHVRKAEFFDSMKLIGNISVDEVAKSYGIPFRKLDIDYKQERAKDYTPSPLEVSYVNADCKIIACALKKLFELGIKGLTIGQSAMRNFKEMNKAYKTYFPTLGKDVEEDIRQAYKGGFTYLNPCYREVETEPGFFLDKNSMFPTMMMRENLPIGRPIFFEGQYKPNSCFPLYIQKISVVADLKPGKVPFLRSKNSTDYNALDYIESTNGEFITFTLTSPEMELLFDNYDVSDIVYHSGWQFSSCRDVFTKYIDFWSSEKEKAKEAGNKAQYMVAKMFLNALIGKFGARSTGRQKKPVMNAEGVVEYKSIGKESRKSIYSPVALFSTAYARCDLVRTIEKIRDYGFEKYGRDVYVYSDTDSIACTLPIEDLEDISKMIELDDKLMGAWKLEKVFSKARFLHSKCYMTIDQCGIPHATIASMPKELAKRMNFENFAVGFSTKDMKDDPELERLMSLQPKYVPGGVILEPIPFTIK